MKRRVVSMVHLPARSPLVWMIIWEMAIRLYGIKGSWEGFGWAVIVVMWLAFFYGRFFVEEWVEPVWARDLFAMIKPEEKENVIIKRTDLN